MGTYTKSSTNRAARPRSERLRESGGVIVSTSTSVMGGGGLVPSGDGHSHANLASLNMITVTDGYIYLTDTFTDETTGDQVTETVKASVGFADRAGTNADGYTLDWFIPVTVDGSLTLKLNPVYAGVWAEGWGAFGGIGSSGGGGGSTVTVTQILTTGTSIATITVDGVATTLYAPANGGGGSTVAWGTVSGYKVPLTVDGTTKTLLMDGALTEYATQTWVGLQGFLTSETDPTVPSWAKASSKPSYSLSEISGTDDLRVIESLTGTGLLKRTGTNTWTMDSTSYLSSHQTIYALTLSAGSFNSGTYTPNSAAASFSIPTTLDHISDGSTRKLANYLPLSGGTMTGAITMSGANIIPATDNTCKIGESDYRFNQANIRNIYTTFFAFIDGETKAFRGNFAIGNGYASINIAGSPSSHSYMFYDDSGFFFSGGGVPCGRSDHRWSSVYTVDANLSGSMALGGDIIPATDLGSQLGYSTRRFSNACIRDIYAHTIRFRNADNNANTGLISFSLGYMQLRTGSNIDTSFKQLIFDETNGLYPYQSGVNLGYNGANNRWANIYGVNADLSGNLALAQTSHIDIGPLRIEYDTTNKALHVTKASVSDTNEYGFYADGQVSAGGLGGDSAYVRYVTCTQTEYNNLATKDATTMYIIGNPATKVYLGTIQIFSEN